MSRLDGEKWQAEISATFPHPVDVVPPPMGYSLESPIGTFDVFGAIADGTPLVRYCFLHGAHAQAFCERFDSATATATLKRAG